VRLASLTLAGALACAPTVGVLSDGGTASTAASSAASTTVGAANGGIGSTSGTTGSITGSTTGGSTGGGHDGGCVPDAGDLANCGACGHTCPTPVNAAPACLAGVCGRGPCRPGTYDLDGLGLGCQWMCDGGTCTSLDGGTVTVTAAPLPETGIVFQAIGVGGSYGAEVMTSATYTNLGLTGESTPPGLDDAILETSASFSNLGGFNAALH